MGEPSEGTSIEFVGQLLEHPIAKQLMVQENLVELAKKVIPRLLDKSEIFGLRDEFLEALIRAFPDLRPSIPDGTGPLGSSIFDDEEFLLSGIADIEYEYDYDTGEFLGVKQPEEEEEETTEAADVTETTTEASEDSTEENQKSRQPKSLGFENQSTSAGGRIRGGRNLRKRRPRRLRSRKEQLPLDRVISSLNNLISKSLKSILVQHHPRKPPVARRPFHRPG